MLEAPKPENEAARLQKLRALKILDTDPEEAFDRLTSLATRVFDVPIAHISLIDEHREWFKSRCGLDTREDDRASAFCAHMSETSIDSVQGSPTPLDSRYRRSALSKLPWRM